MTRIQPQLVIINAVPCPSAVPSIEEHAEACIARLRCACTQSMRIRTQNPFEPSMPEARSRVKAFPSFCALSWTSCMLAGRCLVMCLDKQERTAV